MKTHIALGKKTKEQWKYFSLVIFNLFWNSRGLNPLETSHQKFLTKVCSYQIAVMGFSTVFFIFTFPFKGQLLLDGEQKSPEIYRVIFGSKNGVTEQFNKSIHEILDIRSKR